MRASFRAVPGAQPPSRPAPPPGPDSPRAHHGKRNEKQSRRERVGPSWCALLLLERGVGRAMGLGGGRQELRPCGPHFAPSLALNAPAQPHRPARTVGARTTVKAMKGRAGRCPAPRPVSAPRSFAATPPVPGIARHYLLFFFLQRGGPPISVRGRGGEGGGGVERHGWREARPAGRGFCRPPPASPPRPSRKAAGTRPTTRGSAVRGHLPGKRPVEHRGIATRDGHCPALPALLFSSTW
ncbi:hypothetical protein FHY09_001097 [Xanthomonas sp. 60]